MDFVGVASHFQCFFLNLKSTNWIVFVKDHLPEVVLTQSQRCKNCNHSKEKLPHLCLLVRFLMLVSKAKTVSPQGMKLLVSQVIQEIQTEGFVHENRCLYNTPVVVGGEQWGCVNVKMSSLLGPLLQLFCNFSMELVSWTHTPSSSVFFHQFYVLCIFIPSSLYLLLFPMVLCCRVLKFSASDP